MGYRLGVDLGTTYTAAAVNVDGRVEMLGLGIRAMQVPSVVFIRDDGEVIVGEAAEQQGAADPDRMVRTASNGTAGRVPGVGVRPELLDGQAAQRPGCGSPTGLPALPAARPGVGG